METPRKDVKNLVYSRRLLTMYVATHSTLFNCQFQYSKSAAV